MACVILWSKRAEKGFNAIVEYLSAEWTEKEVRGFCKRDNAIYTAFGKEPLFTDTNQDSPRALQRSGK
jgi:hypothetical protein